MASDDYTCLVESEQVIRLHLSPNFSSTYTAGILNELESAKFKYTPLFEGILIRYQHLKIIGASGDAGSDGFRLVCKVRGTFAVFTPNVGSILKARVNRVSREHVGCVLHDSINLSIRLDADTFNEVAPFLILDHDILFEVMQIDNNMWDIVRMKGKITPECVELMNQMYPTLSSNTHTYFDENGNLISDQTTEDANEPHETHTKTTSNATKNQYVQNSMMSFLEDSLSSLKTNLNLTRTKSDDKVEEPVEVVKLDPDCPTSLLQSTKSVMALVNGNAAPSAGMSQKPDRKPAKTRKKKESEKDEKKKKGEKDKKKGKSKSGKDKTKSSKKSSKKPKDKAKRLKDKLKTKKEEALKKVRKKKKKKKDNDVNIVEIKVE